MGAEAKISLAGILAENRVLPQLRAKDRWEAIDEMVACLVQTGVLRPEQRQSVVAALRKRESTMSTGIGSSVGIPHAALDFIREPVGVLGRSAQGIEFEAVDLKPVTLVVLFLLPQGQVHPRLNLLVSITRLLRRADVRSALEQAPNAAAMLDIVHRESPPSTI